MEMTRAGCEQLDREDPLGFARARFVLPDGVIYLDGNSLGALPVAARDAMARTVETEWGTGLIRSWNAANWVGLAREIGGGIARLVGAGPDEVVVADSTSVNLYKLLAGELAQAQRADARRRVIVSERGNFPTDLYMAQGLASLPGANVELRLVEGGDPSAHFGPDVAVAMLTQVDYRTGRVHDMAAVNRAARDAGHRVVWDLSHSAGALPLALGRDGVELAVGCGYKYLNGGPGAPAFVYLAKALQANFPVALAGWFGHAAPFNFDARYAPAPGIERLQCGTPPVLALRALQCGVATFEGIDLSALRKKSLALSDLFWQLMDSHCGEFGFACVSPRDPAERGSQLSFSHPQAWPVMQAIIGRGVIGDYREPNLMRFGFAPLYLRHVDIWDAVMVVRETMRSGSWKDARHQARNAVT